jgi:hypothetical protein
MAIALWFAGNSNLTDMPVAYSRYYGRIRSRPLRTLADRCRRLPGIINPDDRLGNALLVVFPKAYRPTIPLRECAITVACRWHPPTERSFADLI